MGNYNRKVNEMDSKDEKDGFMSVQEDEELPFEQTELWSLSGRVHLYTLARGVSQKGASFEEFLPIIMCFYIAIANLNENKEGTVKSSSLFYFFPCIVLVDVIYIERFIQWTLNSSAKEETSVTCSWLFIVFWFRCHMIVYIN